MIRFTHPIVESLAESICKAHNGNLETKVINPNTIHSTLLLSDASDETQAMLLREADRLEKAANAYRAVHAFNETARILGTGTVEVEDN
jgi:predicted glutamine amidotransferase